MCVEILPAHATSDPPDRSGAPRRAPHPRRHNDEVPAAAAGPDHLGAPHRLPRTFAAHGAAADIDQTSRRFHGSSLCKLTCGFVRRHARASQRSAAAPVAAVANGGDRDLLPRRSTSGEDVAEGNIRRRKTAAILKVAKCNLRIFSRCENTIKKNGCEVIEKQV